MYSVSPGIEGGMDFVETGKLISWAFRSYSHAQAQMQANGTGCCQWECSHWMQAISKEFAANLCAHVQCDLRTFFAKIIGLLVSTKASETFVTDFLRTLEKLQFDVHVVVFVKS